MGCCMSTTNTSSPPRTHQSQPQPQPQQTGHNFSAAQTVEKEADGKLGFKRKEVFVIQHRRSHDTRSEPKDSASDSDGLVQSTISSESGAAVSNVMARAANGTAVGTSSCTKEEVDAILIQCGRLSRSSSGRKFSGSKRSHDFDGDNDISGDLNCDDEDRYSRRQSRGSHRRRNPSRSREPDPEIQRSVSLDRTAGGGRRRVSRSPARRSVSPGGVGFRPGKMMSVPATVPSVSIENRGNGGSGEVKRVLVRRNVGEGFAVSPGSRSPARSGSQPSLSRSSSRKAEQSPYRRAPLKELEGSSLPFHPLANRVTSPKGLQKSGEIDEVVEKQIVNVVSQNKLGVEADSAKFAVHTKYRGANSNHPETSAEHLLKTRRDPLETVKLPPNFTRSRSSRRSRDLDIEVEALSNNSDPTTNYNSLLLQDIQKFHQKTSLTTNSTSATKTPPPLPARISKARSIAEAVAELNSSTSSNLSSVYGDDKQNPHMHVTVRQKGSVEEESSGSCCTAESTDRWTSSSIEEGVSPAGFQRRALSRVGCEDFERRLLSGHRRQLSDEYRKGMMRSMLGGAER